MKPASLLLGLVALSTTFHARAAWAQQSSAVPLVERGTVGTKSPSPSLMVDLMKDVSELEKKVIGLARAIPAAQYDWRPGAGVRSVGEVLQHIAADNYLLPLAFGIAADPATGITTDYKTVQAYETRKATPQEIVSALEKSFVHLRNSMASANAQQLSSSYKFFGQDFTGQSLWILTTTHLHEHLGQMIAYSRTNNVKPPWSR